MGQHGVTKAFKICPYPWTCPPESCQIWFSWAVAFFDKDSHDAILLDNTSQSMSFCFHYVIERSLATEVKSVTFKRNLPWGSFKAIRHDCFQVGALRLDYDTKQFHQSINLQFKVLSWELNSLFPNHFMAHIYCSCASINLCVVWGLQQTGPGSVLQHWDAW